MFEAFDFNVLDDPGFKEDAVREEIVAPMLKRLGYSASGPVRVERSKTLKHPYVLIGSRKHPVHVVPDYTLWHGDRSLLVLDAKAPDQEIVASHHVEQAYSYAIHPEVRAWHYALCNGRALVVFDIAHGLPVFSISIQDVDSNWTEVERHLSPKYLLNPNLRHFKPDLGTAVARLGTNPGAEHIFLGCRPQLLAKVNDELFTAAATCEFGAGLHLASFDLVGSQLKAVLAGIPAPLRSEVDRALSSSPFQVSLDLMLEVDWVTRLGPPTQGADDLFRPFLVTEVTESRFNTDPPERVATDFPPFVFRLWHAYETSKNAAT